MPKVNVFRPETLEDLALLVEDYYPFTKESHPNLPQDEEGRVLPEAIIQHCLNHLNKSSIGTIAMALESHDHGKKIDESVIIEAVVKMMINSAKILEAINFDIVDACRLVPEAMRLRVNDT